MKETLTWKYRDLIKENFAKWIDHLVSNKQNVGESLAEVWNQYAEDVMNDSLGLLDLKNREDFATLFIDGRYIEIAREKGIPSKDLRWAMVGDTYKEKVSEDDYTFYDEGKLVDLCLAESASIADCIIAWPSLYSRDLYEFVVWPIISKENLIDLDL